jgi:hypothetical protein
MTETFAALLFAHVLADFLFQTNAMVARKRHPLTLALHGAIVWATAALALGSLHPALLLLALLHIAIDAAKAYAPWKGLAPFLTDQALHLLTLITLTLTIPTLWANGLWAAPGPEGWVLNGESPLTATTLPPIMTLITGFILATRAGGFVIGLYMARWQNDWPEGLPVGLPGGGRAIGHLERALIFLLILTGQAGGIGFLIAAKSVLRFGAVSDDRKFSEYVITGTLASFGWAIAIAGATVWMLAALPPLGLPDLSP